MKKDGTEDKKLQKILSSEAYEAWKMAYSAEHRPSHDHKWRQLGKQQSEVAHRALVRADEIRSEDIEAADAYLQGVADAYAALERQRILEELK